MDKSEHFKQVRGTHKLESTDRCTSQEMERIQVSKEHLPTGECRQVDKLGHGKNQSEQEHSHPGEHRQTDTSGHRKERARGTHLLESIDRWTSQDKEII